MDNTISTEHTDTSESLNQHYFANRSGFHQSTSQTSRHHHSVNVFFKEAGSKVFKYLSAVSFAM